MEITTVGFDLAKKVFQVHGINVAGDVLCARRYALRRCAGPSNNWIPAGRHRGVGTSHYWAREIAKLGHDLRLMPPADVKPYVKPGKSDTNDPEAICKAVPRQTMRYVTIESATEPSISRRTGV